LPGKTEEYQLNGKSNKLEPLKGTSLVILSSGKHTLSYNK